MSSRTILLAAAVTAALFGASATGASAQVSRSNYAAPAAPNSYNSNDLVQSGHQFFGSASRGLALAVEEAVRRWGEPNGYILGQEASGAFFGGLRYGEGKLFTRNAGQQRVFWQGPSLGFDVGGEGARTMMLVYNLPAINALYRRFVGVDGSAYLVGGFGISAAAADEMVVVPIRTGVGARLGVNMGYLKFTPEPTWNPF
ncbi:DUF1134 domain-containing protein [Microvirga sp. 17 mud 1-3]|uniref:DUF1134 domain-containing protein n=1 Tax=Microvirga sp. 17 mud 1-3 TaxID=2082949 RepID=UPI000D6B08FD|nr:DUF1134 domain-containing protein [Microvirga sp. 17 mud 1-3]AWM86079.1 DUF1134 domain-containing protein [Microvirga sp. 17 mud 1-3]